MKSLSYSVCLIVILFLEQPWLHRVYCYLDIQYIQICISLLHGLIYVLTFKYILKTSSRSIDNLIFKNVLRSLRYSLLAVNMRNFKHQDMKWLIKKSLWHSVSNQTNMWIATKHWKPFQRTKHLSVEAKFPEVLNPWGLGQHSLLMGWL